MLGFDYFKLLDLLTIARSRRHIEKYYGTAETGKFPERLKPINYKPDVDRAGEFSSIRDINNEIRRLTLAAYAPLQARAQKVRVAKEGNCFIEGTNYRAVDRLASTLSGPELGPRLAALCARWLYSACLCFALPLAEQQRLDFQYRYSIWQLEYSRNYHRSSNPYWPDSHTKNSPRLRPSFVPSPSTT